MIDEKLKFYGLLDFYPRRFELRDLYQEKTTDEKIIYKMFVYSLCFEREYVKDLIWEFLNGWDEGQFELSKERRIRLKKMKDRMKYESENNVEAGQLE